MFNNVIAITRHFPEIKEQLIFKIIEKIYSLYYLE
jgi:hypothetical protein